MIYKNTNGFVTFTFQSIQEWELVRDMLPISTLVPSNTDPLTFIPASQACQRMIIAGQPLSPLAIPTQSNENVIEGFEANSFTYSFDADNIISRDSVVQKVNLSKNSFGLYTSTFLLQPYAMVNLNGKAASFEAVFLPDPKIFVYTYIKFEL